VPDHEELSSFDEPRTQHERAAAFSPRRMWQPRVQRIGATLRSLVLFACGASLLVGAAIVLDPRTIQATPPPNPDAQTRADLRAEFTKTLATLIESCVEVIAIHPRGATPYSEVVLWKNDDSNPGSIDPGEIAVVSHSQLLNAVTVYSLQKGKMGADLAQTHGLKLDRATLQQPAFCDRWRALPAVQPRVIGSGISDMTLTAEPDGRERLSHLLLWLRWTTHSTDGATEASALIDVGQRRQAQE
jgi:hypothetical protein